MAASLYLVTKPSAYPVPPRRLLTAVEYVTKAGTGKLALRGNEVDPEACFLSEGSYQVARNVLVKTEAQMLRVLGFQTHVALPHALCINYLQTLDLLPAAPGQNLAPRVLAHLNTALFSPQLLYLTHQPCALATAAIYLAAKEIEVKLPDNEWWEVFDVDREDLGFLVVGLMSTNAFAIEEARKWSKRAVPMTTEGVQSELETRHMLETGE